VEVKRCGGAQIDEHHAAKVKECRNERDGGARGHRTPQEEPRDQEQPDENDDWSPETVRLDKEIVQYVWDGATVDKAGQYPGGSIAWILGELVLDARLPVPF
jgi:hypothetical protein